jgi:hypothetical protein
MALHIPAVLQAQGAKFLFGKLPRLPTAQLIAVLGGAG